MRTGLWLAGLGLAVLGVGGAAAQQDLSAERRALMRQQVQAMRALAPIVQGNGEVRSALQPAEAVLATAQRKLALFPPGSDRDDDRARPEIWTDRAAFDAYGASLIQGATAMIAAANAGDRAALTAAFQATSNTCNACHDRFRLPQRQ